MTVEALIFDVDGTLADTEEAHRIAFNLAFEQQRLGWAWSRNEYRALLAVNGGKERIASYIRALPMGEARRAHLLDRVGAIHAEKTKLYSSVVRDGGIPLRDGVARLLDEALQAGCRLAIASTTTAVNVDALLQSTLGRRGLEMFDVIACGDRCATRSPRPTSTSSRCARSACPPTVRWRSRIRPMACAPPSPPVCGPWSRRPSGPKATTLLPPGCCCRGWATRDHR